MDINILNDYKARKLVKCQVHPTRDLIIWNYTDIVQMKGPWDEVTSRTRGLITDSNGNIIAHSFRKFHNIESGLHKASPEFCIYDKLDGSLGILFWHDDTWIISSRGSFTSEQAKYAQQLLDTKYNVKPLDKRLAYSFEIIYPENRIVVDYKDMRELVFLAAFKPDGTEVDVTDTAIDKCGFPIVKCYDYKDYDNIKELNWKNAEGFVVKFNGTGDRTKIKFADYCALHRSVTNLNGLRVWELFATGQNLEEVIGSIPDEFYEWVKLKWDSLQVRHDDIMSTAIKVCQEADEATNNKAEFAKIVSKHEYSTVIFGIYNKKDVKPHIIKMIRPTNGMSDIPYTGRTSVDEVPIMETKPEIIVMIGLSGSGKSTWAKDFIRSHPNSVRVNRDTIRMMLYGYTEETIQQYYDNSRFAERERHVTLAEVEIIHTFLRKEKTVIVDSTNLKKSRINDICKEFDSVKISFQLMDTTLEEAIGRDASRLSRVGEEVIQKQHEKLKVLKKYFDFKPVEPSNNTFNAICQNPLLPKAVVCDLDGTLCIMKNRSPFDWSRVEEDDVCEPVRTTVLALHQAGHKVLIATGRSDEAAEGSKRWLAKHGVPYDGFYCRKQGDYRVDSVAKEEMWREMIRSYYIDFMLDDRQQVVDHARARGFKVFQVEPHKF